MSDLEAGEKANQIIIERLVNRKELQVLFVANALEQVQTKQDLTEMAVYLHDKLIVLGKVLKEELDG